MSLLHRSFVDLNQSLVRCLKTDASRAASGSRGFYQKTVLTSKNSEEGSCNPSNDKDPHNDTPAEFLKHRERMKERFPEGWNPPRKLSREAMDGLRTLHGHDPKTFSTPVLAERFRVSPEAVRRILKSKWTPNKEEKAKMLEKDRRRKGENIARRIQREKADKWAQLDSHEKPREPRRERDDGFSLV